MRRLATLLLCALAACLSAPAAGAQGGPEDYHRRAMARFKQGDAEGAIADLNQASKLFPKYDAAYASRTQIKKSRGDLEYQRTKKPGP